MIVWIFSSDGNITVCKTKERAIKFFIEQLDLMKLSGMRIDEDEKRKIIEQIEKIGYWYDYKIYSTKIYD